MLMLRCKSTKIRSIARTAIWYDRMTCRRLTGRFRANKMATHVQTAASDQLQFQERKIVIPSLGDLC